MSPRVEGNAQVAIAATRALPIPTKAVGYEQRTPVRTGHKPIKHGTPEGYDRHRQRGEVGCGDCLRSIKPKPLRAAKPEPAPKGPRRKPGPPKGTLGTVRVDYDRQEAARLYRQGWTTTQLAEHYHTTRETIRRHLTRAGVDISQVKLDPKKAEELHLQGMPLSAIAAELGFAYFTVYKALRKLGYDFSRRAG